MDELLLKHRVKVEADAKQQIWLRCPCKWMFNCGMNPSPLDLLIRTTLHKGVV